jgi:hypothetical protein
MIDSYEENGFFLSKNILTNEDLDPIKTVLLGLAGEVFPFLSFAFV